jgi:type I restriction enzyme S subunit
MRLGDVCLKIGSGATPRGGKDVYLAGGGVATLIRSQNIYNDRFDRAGLVHLLPEHAEQLQNVEVQAGDILLNITGDSVARVCQVPDDVLPARVNQHVAIIRPDPAQLHPRFLRFFLASPQMQAHMLALAAAGATRNALTKGMIEGFTLPAFSLPQQHSIAAVLGALEDKIDLNSRANNTLEDVTRAVFKDWFVDFGPTHAKAEGRSPYLVPELWVSFPDALNEDGMPVGWNILQIKNVANDIQYGLTRSATPKGPGPRFLRITDIQGGQVVWPSVPFCEASKEEEEKYKLVTGDIVVARTGASTGENLYITEPPRSVFASYLVRFQFVDIAIARVVAQFMRSIDYRLFVAGAMGGSAQPNASAQLLGSAPMVFPDERAAHAFFEFVSPMDRVRRSNECENETLAHLRDLLLPKLMSGEIRLKDAEKNVEEAL